MTDRFRFWCANLAVIDRSFKHKTRKLAVMYSSLAQEQVSVFSNMTDDTAMTADCETVVKSLVFLERCL